MEIRQSNASEKLVFRALAWSLLIHLFCFAAWKEGKTHGWWQNAPPRWLQDLTKTLLTPVANKVPPPQKKHQEVPLIFVDTDPALALKDPPKDAKFYSANSTAAANSEVKKISDLPNITGHQEHVPKPTDAAKSKAQPLQPSPKPEEQQQEQPEKKPMPAQKVAVGDLAMAKPNDGKAQTNTDAVEPQPEHHRPRTLEQARQQSGLLGEKMHQDGGVPNMGPHASFAAVGKSYGDYDRDLIDAVTTAWYQLLDARPPTVSGHVVVEFRLLPTGRVTDVKIVENTVDDFYGTICSSAILNPAPFRPWPRQMQLDLGTDHRDVRFTFYYGE